MHLEHEALRRIAWARYDPGGVPIECSGETAAMETKEVQKLVRRDVDTEGYVWVCARVFTGPATAAAMHIQAEFAVTESTPLSIAAHPLYHVRKVASSAVAMFQSAHVEEEELGEEQINLNRPGWVANTPKGLVRRACLCAMHRL